MEHLQALQAAQQPQPGQPTTQYRAPPVALPGATVQLPTPGGTGQRTESQRKRQRFVNKVIKEHRQRQAAAPKPQSAAVAVPIEGPGAHDAVQGAVVSVDRITTNMWSQVTGMENFVRLRKVLRIRQLRGAPRSGGFRTQERDTTWSEEMNSLTIQRCKRRKKRGTTSYP